MPRVIHFDIPADDTMRAQKFYQEVFGWKFDKWNGPMEYWMIKTGDEKQPGINGGLSMRMGQSGTTNTIDVSSIDEFSEKNNFTWRKYNNDQDCNSRSWMVCTVQGH